MAVGCRQMLSTKKGSIIAVVTAPLGAVVVFWAFGCASGGQGPAATATGGPSTRSSAPSGDVPTALGPDASLVVGARVKQPAVTDAGSSADGVAVPHAPISSPCVLHAGQAQKHTRRVRLPGGGVGLESVHGSCSANAECIVKKAQETSGDGFVRLECSERACTCWLEPIASNTAPITSTFELSAPCTTSSEAFNLIVERCMTGMTVVSRH